MTKPSTHAPDSKTADSETSAATDRQVLPLKLKDYFVHDSGDAYYFAWAATRLHVGIRFENMADEGGLMCTEVTLYEDVPTVLCGDVDDWWPVPRGWRGAPSVPMHSDDLWDALSDRRWEEEQARAFMIHVHHEPGCCSTSGAGRSLTRQEWFVEFSGLELTADCDYNSFPHLEEHSGRS